MTEFRKELEVLLEKIQKEGPTEAFRRSARLSLRHLENQNLGEVAIFLEMFCKDVRKWPPYLNAQRHSARRHSIQALLGNSDRLRKKIFVETHRDVLEELRKLRDQAQTQETKDTLQSVIVKLQAGDKTPALVWLRQERLRQRQKARQANYGQRTIHSTNARFAENLAKQLEKL